MVLLRQDFQGAKPLLGMGVTYYQDCFGGIGSDAILLAVVLQQLRFGFRVT